MEVKVFVDGIPRVVCGVTRETTCQEVVLVLAQALGQPGRYTLREKFKDFERCMTPEERLLETLERYGEQSKEVQLSLFHRGASVLEEMGKAKVGRYQPCPLHRQSLPMLSCLREEGEKKQEDLKRPKRKSLTLMEEAWDWLESLGKGKVYSTAHDKESSNAVIKLFSTHYRERSITNTLRSYFSLICSSDSGIKDHNEYKTWFIKCSFIN
uniref:Ras-associating domain-containing protein n=1 Tax=Oreochromis aureus TaxID=47969 RepID=A0AAZ1WZ27_OREAU